MVEKEADGSASGEGGDINATGSTLRSLDPKSQNITLTAGSQTGKMNLVNLDIDTVRADPALDPTYKKVQFLAKDCHLENLRGVPETVSCDADDVLERLEEAAKLAQEWRAQREAQTP